MQVVSVFPAPQSIGVPLGVNIQVTFDRLVDTTTLNAGTMVVYKKTMVGVDEILIHDTVSASTAVEGTFTFQHDAQKTIAIFNPAGLLSPNSEYTVVLSQEILGQDNSPLDAVYSWKFTTGSEAVVEPPGDTSTTIAFPYRSTPITPLSASTQTFLTLLSASPPHGSSNLPLNTRTITLNFNAPLDSSRFSSAACQLTALPVDGNPGTPASGTLRFAVAVVDEYKLRVVIDLEATPLRVNNKVSLTLTSLFSTTGLTLPAPLEYHFTTQYEPLYGSHIMIRSRIGSYINDLPDETIYLALYLASLEADGLIRSTVGLSADTLAYLDTLKGRYAQVTASLTLLVNSSDFSIRRKSKSIGDMDVSWEQSPILERLYLDLRREQEELEQALLNLGKPNLLPKMAIKGSWDVDRPMIGRGFDPTPAGAPAANMAVVPLRSRRAWRVWND